MHSSKKSKSRSSLIKGFVLLVLLILGFMIASRIKRFGLPSQASSLINIDYDVSRQKMSQLKESQQDSLRKAFAGFWVSETNGSNTAVKKSDHLELRDNGIIWQVINWFVTFPSGDTISMYLVRNAYLIPYGKHSGKSGYACDVRIIRQTFIVGQDTCYGASQADELWLVEKNSDGIKFNDRFLQNYHGELSSFFPEGMIDLVDKLELVSCAPGSTLQMFANDAIKQQLKGIAAVDFKEESVHQWIDNYFNPIIVDDILHSQLIFSVPESLTVSFAVSSEGNVLEPVIKSGKKGRVSEMLIQNIRSWSFPKHTQTAKTPIVVHTFHLFR